MPRRRPVLPLVFKHLAKGREVRVSRIFPEFINSSSPPNVRFVAQCGRQCFLPSGISEAIADSWLGLDDPRSGRVHLNLLAKLTSDYPKILNILLMCWSPGSAKKLCVRENSTWMLRKFGQNGVFLRRKVDVFAGSTNSAGQQVDFNIVDSNFRLPIARDVLAQCAPQTGKDLVGVEGLRHIIVGAEVKRGDLLLRRFACGYHEERRSRFDDRLDKLQSLAIGQSEVEQHRGGLVDLQCVESLARSSDGHDNIPVSLERCGQQSPNGDFVIDDNNLVAGHSATSVCLTSFASGKRIVKHAPGPSLLLDAVT